MSTDTFGSIATAFPNGETVTRDVGSFGVSVSMERCRVIWCVCEYGEVWDYLVCLCVWRDVGSFGVSVNMERCRVFWCVCEYGEI